MRPLLILGVLSLPYISFASIFINEVAWMGSVDSPNHEWIELYNSGKSTSLDGWMLHDENNLTIELEGEISSGSFAVLERTSDASALGSAFLLYTGALSNGGATLVLRNSDGEVVDQISGSEDWVNIGGSNETKDTAQRLGSVWKTAPATPGEATLSNSISTVVDESSTEANFTSLIGIPVKRSEKESELTLPGVSLQLAILAKNTAHVGQPFIFDVEPSGVGKTIADSLTYEWSLGNGEKRLGKEVEYTFRYPGEYVVVVSGEYKRQKQFARQTIRVLPVELKLIKSADAKSYMLHNVGLTEVDVGGYRLVGSSEHTFPKHTIILSQNKINIPVTVIKSSREMVVLYDETGESIAFHVSGFIEPTTSQNFEPVPVSRTAAAAFINQQSVQPSSNFGFATDEVSQPLPALANTDILPAQIAAVAAVPNNAIENNLPTYALIALLILGTIGIYLVPQKKDDPPWV